MHLNEQLAMVSWPIIHPNQRILSLTLSLSLGIIGRDPSDSKSNWLHVVIFRFLFNIQGIFHKFL